MTMHKLTVAWGEGNWPTAGKGVTIVPAKIYVVQHEDDIMIDENHEFLIADELDLYGEPEAIMEWLFKIYFNSKIKDYTDFMIADPGMRRFLKIKI